VLEEALEIQHGEISLMLSRTVFLSGILETASFGIVDREMVV
jgi:hypothetical protein